MYWKWTAIVGLLLTIVIAGLLAREWHAVQNTPLQITEQEILEIERGEGFSRLAQRLEERGWVDDSLPLRVWSRLSGHGQSIRAGEYGVGPDTTVPELVEKLERGDVIQYQFTLVEGWTFDQVLDAMHEHDAIEATLEEVDADQVMPLLGFRELHPEGWFLPDTYRFPRGTTDRQILQRAHERMREFLDEAWARRQGDLPLENPYDALILASIIERETGRIDERERVAGVFVRRLERNMRLQTDPTVIYGLDSDDYDGRLRYRHLRTDTPYNTYTRHGLPPTPIAMPGRQAIDAAVNPDDSEYLYFVSRGDGSHHFSETLEEHNRAVRKYQLGQEVELDSGRDSSDD